MVETEIKRRSPLGPAHRKAHMHLTIEVVPVACRLLLRGDSAKGPTAAVLGGALPSQPCRASFHGTRASLWLGPDEWLLLDLASGPSQMLAELTTALALVPHSLVDISHRQIAVQIAGPQAAAALAMFVPLDVSPDAFPTGMVVRTIFEKSEVVIWRKTPELFHLEVWRSFAEYVESLLQEAGRELDALSA